METRRHYRLGRRQASVDRTATAILGAARELVAERPSSEISVGAIAGRAGVSRITIYNRFGSRERLLAALAPPPHRPEAEPADAPGALRVHLEAACARWAADPRLYRHLSAADRSDGADVHGMVERIAAADALRPGCSLKEAEDVIAALSSFAVFDRLHKDGRRTPAAVAEILIRLAAAVLA